MAYKRENTFDESESLPSLASKLNREIANLERAFAGLTSTAKTITVKSKASGSIITQPPPQQSGAGYPSVRSLNGNTYILAVPEIVIDTDSALTLTTLANGAVLISATGGTVEYGGPFINGIMHGVSTANIAGKTIYFPATMPNTEYGVFVRGYKSDLTPVGGIKVVKAVGSFIVYPPEDATLFDYTVSAFSSQSVATTGGKTITLGTTKGDTTYPVLIRAYKSDNTPVDGYVITKTVNDFTVTFSENDVCFDYIVEDVGDYWRNVFTSIDNNLGEVGCSYSFSPAQPHDDFTVILRAYLTSDQTPVEGIKVQKSVGAIDFTAPEAGVTIEFMVRIY